MNFPALLLAKLQVIPSSFQSCFLYFLQQKVTSNSNLWKVLDISTPIGDETTIHELSRSFVFSAWSKFFGLAPSKISENAQADYPLFSNVQERYRLLRFFVAVILSVAGGKPFFTISQPQKERVTIGIFSCLRVDRS
ncbi:hypothetical protein AVEN_220378-1 [Araneus ventricosus]|uniref:Uncharacterized protein n=1 Tax=Araneus ventricosus TaxID=182803 RepID=A0A4Y2TY89_ARAVE|nr:hypothetical protein AVEN_220378-1 [Araneus ventricosus]